MHRLFLFLLPSLLLAADWPQWQGPHRNGLSSETTPDIADMKEAWRREIGVGFSGIATAKGRAYTMGNDGQGTESLWCLDLNGGSIVWKQQYPGKLMPKLHAGGPNTTPLITGDRIYSLSKDGQIHCRKLADGALIWQQSLPKLLGMQVPKWGFASSPQIVNGQLLFGSAKTIALNPDSGEKLWISDTKGQAGYSTPSAFTIGDKPYGAIMTAEGAHVISLDDGKTLASFRMSARFAMIATTPIIMPGADGEIFAATSHIAARLRFDGKNLTPLWTTKEMKNKLSNSKLIDGYLYGIDGGQGKPDTRIVCMDAATGKTAWAKANTGHGTLVAGKGSLIFLSDNGELIQFAATAEEFKELGRRSVLSKICWTEPTLSGGKLLLRNDKGTLVCLTN